MQKRQTRFLDRINLLHPSTPAELKHELQKGSGDEITIKPTIVKQSSTLDNPQRSSALALEKEKLNLRSKGIQQKINPNIRKKIEQVARKTVRLATKVKEPNIFEQKHKKIDGKILTYTPRTAWVQTKGRQPR